jgi:hypothetical protein
LWLVDEAAHNNKEWPLDEAKHIMFAALLSSQFVVAAAGKKSRYPINTTHVTLWGNHPQHGCFWFEIHLSHDLIRYAPLRMAEELDEEVRMGDRYE